MKTNKIWEQGGADRLVGADAPRGGTSAADYSGLHRYDAAAQPAPCTIFVGAEATARVAASRRREAELRDELVNGPRKAGNAV